jgi:hypothetical protein
MIKRELKQINGDDMNEGEERKGNDSQCHCVEQFASNF